MKVYNSVVKFQMEVLNNVRVMWLYMLAAGSAGVGLGLHFWKRLKGRRVYCLLNQKTMGWGDHIDNKIKIKKLMYLKCPPPPPITTVAAGGELL